MVFTTSTYPLASLGEECLADSLPFMGFTPFGWLIPEPTHLRTAGSGKAHLLHASAQPVSSARPSYTDLSPEARWACLGAPGMAMF